jgi:hypothetical protein
LIWDLRSVRYSYTVGVDVIMVDAWEDHGQHQRAFLHAAMEGDLDILTGTYGPECFHRILSSYCTHLRFRRTYRDGGRAGQGRWRM